MTALAWLALFQTVAIIYLLWRVHRLEQSVAGRRRAVRGEPQAYGEHKVIPLLKEQLPQAPFKGRPTPPSSNPRK